MMGITRMEKDSRAKTGQSIFVMKFYSGHSILPQFFVFNFNLRNFMNKQLKKAAVAVIFAITATTSFAASSAFTDAVIANTSADVTTFETLATTEMSFPYGNNTAIENVALVAQSGDSNLAYINQTGTGNFAAIVQNPASGSGAVSNVAYAIQTGDNNRAVIIQH